MNSDTDSAFPPFLFGFDFCPSPADSWKLLFRRIISSFAFLSLSLSFFLFITRPLFSSLHHHLPLLFSHIVTLVRVICLDVGVIKFRLKVRRGEQVPLSQVSMSPRRQTVQTASIGVAWDWRDVAWVWRDMVGLGVAGRNVVCPGPIVGVKDLG